MDGMYEVGIILSKEHISFSKAEVEHVFNDADIAYSNNLAVFSTDDMSEFHDLVNTLSYGKSAYEIIAQDEGMDEMLRNVEAADVTQYALPDETYKIDSYRIGNTHQATDRGLLAGLTNTTGELQVDVENPDALFVHIKGEKHTFGRQIWENDEPFTSRRNDNLPESHPTAMDPRMGRAMINIAQPETGVLDPFCGSGGILIEAGLLGYDAYGIDHDSRMIDRARANLDAFDLDATLSEGDALKEAYAEATIVTDVPYGKNSSTSKDSEKLFASFIDRLSDDYVGTAVICYPARESYQSIVDVVATDESSSFDFYVNRSLTRRVTRLEFS